MPPLARATWINQVRFAYNDFGQLTEDCQAHAGTVNVSTTPKVQYGYADGSANTVRPASLTYPDGRVLTYDYGTSGGIDESISRTASLIDNDGTTHLADYSYLGLGTSVEASHPEPHIRFTLVDLTGTNDPDTGDVYSGLDRFGRIKDNRWYNTGTATDVDRIKYGYDRAGNRLWRQNTVAEGLGKGFDELYSYDGLYRLADMQRGTLSTDKTAITGKTFAQDWSLDATGNWSGFDEDDNGDGAWNLIQVRTANKVNEITGISETAGPSWVTPAYSAAGNMTTMTQPADPTTGYTGTYDAWNRLVAIADGSDTISEYAYDGARRRIIQKSYAGGTLSETKHLYYTQPSQWQVLEEHIGTSINAERQFVWGLRYIDDCLLRDRDTNADGTLDERLYACQDPNWNVTALADATGDIQERYAYSAYGVPLFLTPTFANRATSSAGLETLYCGYRYETATGLCHVRNRVYLPMVGVWLMRDLAGYADGPNLYMYAACMPTVLADPSGNFTLNTVLDFFNWYYTGGGTPVDLPTMAPGVFAAWLKEITPELDTFKSDKMKDILGGAINCDRPNRTISGNSSIRVSAGGGLTNVLTVMGNSLVHVNYSCQVTVECETCCDGNKVVKQMSALCKYNFRLEDRFANPLDSNGQSYERDDKAWASCVVDCMGKSQHIKYPPHRVVYCMGICDAKYPPSEFPFATPYAITATWTDFSRKSWDYKGCPKKP